MTWLYMLTAIYLGTLSILLACHYMIYKERVKLLYKLIDKIEEVLKTLGGS